MKKIIAVVTAIGIGFGMMNCGGPSENNATSSDEQTTQPFDTTYMESEDNNGQTVTDGEGGTVTETKGAPESGYGNANGTESHPSASGSSGSATQRGTDDDARK